MRTICQRGASASWQCAPAFFAGQTATPLLQNRSSFFGENLLRILQMMSSLTRLMLQGITSPCKFSATANNCLEQSSRTAAEIDFQQIIGRHGWYSAICRGSAHCAQRHYSVHEHLLMQQTDSSLDCQDLFVLIKYCRLVVSLVTRALSNEIFSPFFLSRLFNPHLCISFPLLNNLFSLIYVNLFSPIK